jgi:hypothetical protein
VTFPQILRTYLGWVHLPHHSPSSCSPYLEWFRQASMFCLHTRISYMDHLHPPLPSSLPPAPTRTSPLTGPSLFKWMFFAQRGFPMVFHLLVCCASLTPSVTLPYPFPHPYCSTAFNAICCGFCLHKRDLALY